MPVEPDLLSREGEHLVFWDDVNGGYLDPVRVTAARKDEMSWVDKQELLDIVEVSQCYEETGKAPITLKWVDTNKGDEQDPNYRSRLVVREVKARKTDAERLQPQEIFSAMPPLEAMKVLISLFVSWNRGGPDSVEKKQKARGRKPGNYKLGIFDISRAHFYGKAKRRIFVKLPEEYAQIHGPSKCGLLLKSWYGTQDASAIWQQDYADLLKFHSYVMGKANTAIFYSDELQVRGLCHGDDFLVLAQQPDLDSFEAMLRTKYELKKTASLGFDSGDDLRAVFLNRVLEVGHGVPPGEERVRRHVTTEPDSRHAEICIKEMNMTGTKGVETPAVKRTNEKQTADARARPLPPEEATKYRSLTMRIAYLSQDRPDLSEVSKTMARGMQTPLESHMEILKRCVRYLIKYPSMATVFVEQRPPPSRIKVLVDTDHAGCAVTRKSTGGFVVRFGRHTVKHGCNMQTTIALSSGESEYYGIVKGAQIGLGMQTLLEDWDLAFDVEVSSDSSAAKGHVTRRGLGKMRHIQSRYLWVQERVAENHLKVTTVPGAENMSDILTKAVGGALLRKHLVSLGVYPVEKSSMQRKV